MDRKKIIISTTIVLILLILVLGVLWWLGRDDGTSTQQPDTNEPPSSINVPGTLPDIPEGEAPDIVVGESTLVSTAYYFVERWGTFSSVSEFRNIKDLKGVMTPELYAQQEVRFESLAYDQLETTPYIGYTTRVTKVNWVEKTDQRAEAVITTHRIKETKTEQESFNQDIVVVFTNTNGTWLVSDATWN